MIPQEVIGNILDRVSILDVIGRYTEIKKSGRNHLALCPFHQEKTPSFSISEEKGLYHCFGCGASGNTLKFLMDYSKLSFIEALQELAKMASIDLTAFSNEKEYASLQEKEILLKINKEAEAFFNKLLLESQDAKSARDYIKKRKLTLETVKKFRIGYGGSSRLSISEFLKEKGYRDEYILKAGLSCQGSTGIFDRFSGRVIFPILDREGNCVGFGGRILTDDKSQAKYLNSPENMIFHKGNLLFALNFAKEEIIKKKEAFIVEGYMDVIALHQHGIRNTIAPLGTSLTDSQMVILKRYADSVKFIFDGDEAGINAANRALDISVESGIGQSVVILPGKMDPYDYVMENGGASFEKYSTDKALPPIDFKIKYFDRKIDAKKNKVKFVMSVFPYIMKVKSAITREEYLKKTSEAISEDFEVILAEYQNFIRNDKNTGRTIKESPSSGQKAGILEAELIGRLFINPELIGSIQNIISEKMFRDSDAGMIFSLLSVNPSMKPGEIFAKLGNGDIISKISEYSMLSEVNPAEIMELAYKIKAQYITSEVAKISRIIRDYENESNFLEMNKFKKIQEGLKLEELSIKEKITECVKIQELS